MTIVPGELKQIIQTIEVGKKYIANDGKEFATQEDCERYELHLLKNEKFKKAEHIIMSTPFKGLSNEDDLFYIFKCNSYEELCNICTDLQIDPYHTVIKEFTSNTEFPGFYICQYEHTLQDTYYGDDYVYTIKSVNDWQKELENSLQSFNTNLATYLNSVK